MRCLGAPIPVKRHLIAAILSLGLFSLSSAASDGGGTGGGAPDNRPRPRVIVMSDFPPLDVIPVKASYGPPEKRSDLDDV